MTGHTHYQCALDLFAPDGHRPDWELALESVAFEGIRRGHLPAVTGTPRGAVGPIWHAELGEPYVGAFRALVRREGGGAASSEIPTAYVRALARSASAIFVEKGALQAGDVFTYLVCAFPTPEPAADTDSPDGFVVEEIVEPLPLDEAPLRRFVATAVAQGPPMDGDVPVFIPQSVLNEAVELSRKAGDVETGGVLLGKLHRDSALPEVFVEITALIPARHTVSDATKVTFTAETWSAVETAIALRGRAESKAGWFAVAADTRAEIVETAVSRLYSPNADNELCVLKFRDGKVRTVVARELASGRIFEQICRAARLTAFLRDVRGGESGLRVSDIDAAVANAMERLASTISARNAPAYLSDLPQDVDVIAVEPVVHKVARPMRYVNRG